MDGILRTLEIFPGACRVPLRSAATVAPHPDFRVVALGVPVPPFPGRTLDPPLRSRFQAHAVTGPPQPTPGGYSVQVQRGEQLFCYLVSAGDSSRSTSIGLSQ